MTRQIRAQSAMEYLMTYGWAILIIAVVLGALFSLGVFGGSSLIGTSCIAGPGFLCSSITYSHLTGALMVTFGQSTGAKWGGWAILYAPASTSLSANSVPAAAFVLQGGGSTAFTNGQTAIGVNLPVGTGAAVPVGTTLSGDIWVCYVVSPSGIAPITAELGGCTPTSGSMQYAQIATVTARAV